MRAEFADHVALVTGAGSGIGAAVAIHLASEGASIAVADIDELKADRTVHAICEAGGRAEAIAIDVSDPASVEAAVAKTVASFGALHHAVNSAGVPGATALTGEYDPQDWKQVIGIDLSGVFYCMRYEIPALLAAGGGSIVNMSSVLGSNGFPRQAAYAAAKHGVIGLTKSAALEYASSALRINSVAPGFVETPLVTQGLTPLSRRTLLRAHPIGRLGEPAEIAELVAFLLSDRASFITGSNHHVDGGYAAH